jgi:hypothetical protein
MGISLFNWFFSNLVGEEGSRGQGFKGLFSKNFIKAFNILSISAIFFLVYPIQLFQLNLNPLPIISVFLYIYKQSSYDFCQTFNSL